MTFFIIGVYIVAYNLTTSIFLDLIDCFLLKGGRPMKPGLMIGQKATIYTTVTPAMFAQFEGKVVHPAYSTVAMVYHMEWASRQIILPYLEEDEEGMGGAVTVKHLGVSSEGETISATATLSEINGRRLVTKVTVQNSQGLVGEGEVSQFILSKEELKKKLT